MISKIEFNNNIDFLKRAFEAQREVGTDSWVKFLVTNLSKLDDDSLEYFIHNAGPKYLKLRTIAQMILVERILLDENN